MADMKDWRCDDCLNSRCICPPDWKARAEKAEKERDEALSQLDSARDFEACERGNKEEALASVAVLVEALKKLRDYHDCLCAFPDECPHGLAGEALDNLPAAARKFLEEHEAMKDIIKRNRLVEAGDDD